MKVTKEQFLTSLDIFQDHPGDCEKSMRAAIESLPEPLPRLRPLAEMPPDVPEGAVRFFGWINKREQHWSFTDWTCDKDTHFLDVLPPLPESPKPSLQDELVTALEEVAEKLEARVKDEAGFQPELDRVRALIAKAKGSGQP